MTDAHWLQLLERVRGDIPTLLHEFTAELDSMLGYAEGAVPADDIERTALQAFDLFLVRLASDDAGTGATEFPDALGRRRARQGMRVEQFSEGVRINFRMLWRALHRAAQPDLVDVLASHGERVLNVVERYATEVQAAFLDEMQTMAQQHRTARERALAKIFADRVHPDDLAAAATMLHLRPDVMYSLVGIDLAEASATLRSAFSADVTLYEDGELLYAFRPKLAGAFPPESLCVRGAVIGEVRGVAQLASAAALVRRMVRAGEAGTVVSLRDVFASLAHRDVAANLAGFSHELLGRWEDAAPDEQERLIETLRVLMQTGSIKDTSARLFVHRNTVFKRVQAFADLTGLDVQVPRDAAIALILLSGPQ